MDVGQKVRNMVRVNVSRSSEVALKKQYHKYQN